MNQSEASTVVLVGSYSRRHEPGIRSLVVSGAATLRGLRAWSGVDNPSYLALHPDGRHLYAVAETGMSTHGAAGSVHAFRLEGSGPEVDLVPLGSQPSGGDHPCHISFDPSGRWLVVSNYGTGSFSVLPIGVDGNLGGSTAVVAHAGRGPDPSRQQGPHVHSSIFTPDGARLIVADLGLDRLATYAFDAVRGTVSEGPAVHLAPGSGPRHVAVHPDGSHLFLVGELDNTITLLRLDRDGRRLHTLQTLSTVPVAVSDSIAADVQVSPSGRHVYVSNRGDDSVAVFRFDPGQGLRAGPIRPCGGRTPRAFAIGTDAAHLLVANQDSDQVVLLPLTRGGADIGPPHAFLDVRKPSTVVVVPPGVPST